MSKVEKVSQSLKNLSDKYDQNTYIISRKWRKDAILNVPTSFDIETTSFIFNEEKRATMYMWQFSFNNEVFIIGRTWEEFLQLNELVEHIFKHKIVCYVFNLPYEFQFMRKWFDWQNVFCTDDRNVIRADNNIFEFRDAYILANASLDYVCKNLLKYKCEKLVGSLDYSLPRHSGTPLYKKEIEYGINDVAGVVCYIWEEMEQNSNNINLIPMTKTGKVRRFSKNHCFHGRDETGHVYYRWYSKLIQSLTCSGIKELDLWDRCFIGGFTHTSCVNAGVVFQESKDKLYKCKDEASAYPYALMLPEYPMSSGTRVNPQTEAEFLYYINNYCCLFDVEFFDLEDIYMFEHYLSLSHCWDISSEKQIDNGRVVSCKYCLTSMCQLDFFLMQKNYKWKGFRVYNMHIYEKGYLPSPILECVLELYRDKNTLKGVVGKEQEYMLKKANLNSLYGMMATKILRDSIKYENHEYVLHPADKMEAVEKYNKSKKRFTYFPWGIYCTAVARYNLVSNIFKLGSNYLYADTDSISYKSTPEIEHMFDEYNKEVMEKLKLCCEKRFLNFDDVQPMTNNGKRKPLGIFEDDKTFKKVKFLGAKRYIYQDAKGDHITIAGLSKKAGCDYIFSQKEPFEFFNDEMYIPREHTGKLTHTYVDDEVSGFLTDYKGNRRKYYEKSFIHLEPCEFTLNIADDFTRFLDFIQGLYFENEVD